MKKRLFLFGLVLFLSTGSLHVRAQSQVSISIEPKGLKSVSQARSIALTNTITSIATGLSTVSIFEHQTIQKVGAYMAVYGIVTGPSTGNFYAQDYPRGVLGMGVRAVGAYLMMDATREIFGNDFADALNVDRKEVSLTDTKILIGEVLILGSFVYNVLSTQASVDAYNNSRSRFSLNVRPEVVGERVAPMLTASFRL